MTADNTANTQSRFKTIEELVALIRKNTPPEVPPLAMRRVMMDRNADIFPAPSGIGIEPASLDGLPGEWALPQGTDSSSTSSPVLLYFHGGGYTIGSVRSHRHLVTRIAKAANMRVLSVDYTLAPENRFPGPQKQGFQAYRWLLARGHKPETIAVGGDSAGAGLTLAVFLQAREAGLPLPACATLLCPWTDMTCSSPSYHNNADIDPIISDRLVRGIIADYLGDADPRDPLASPNFADLSGLPPLLIQVGSAEMLLDDSRQLADAARKAGVDVTLDIWPGMVHVWQAFYPMLREGGEAIDKIGAYLKERLPAKS